MKHGVAEQQQIDGVLGDKIYYGICALQRTLMSIEIIFDAPQYLAFNGPANGSQAGFTCLKSHE